MLSWIKYVFGLKKKKSSTDSTVHQENGEDKGVKWKDKGINNLLAEDLPRKNNADPICGLPSLTLPPSPPRPPPIPVQYFPAITPIGHQSSWSTEAPVTDVTHVFPESQFQPQCRQSPSTSYMQTKSLSGMPRASGAQGQSLASQDRQLLFSEARIPSSSEQGMLVATEGDWHTEGDEVFGPTTQQDTYPSCILAATLTNQIGELITVKGKRYVQVSIKKELLMVSLEVMPCRVLWQSGKPVPLVELPDLTRVNFDACASPGSERLHAVVVWQKKKPDRCLQLLDNTYMFVDSRSITCQRKSLDIVAKTLSIMFDGTHISAEVCDDVAFIENTEATMVELLQNDFDEFYATVFKMLEGTGRVLYVCTCLWVGKMPERNKRLMVVEKQKLYSKMSHGLYLPSAKTQTLYCDVDASLSISGGTSFIELKIDGSSRVLAANHLFNLHHSNLKDHAAVQVSVHVREEVHGRKQDWSAIMMNLPGSPGTEAVQTCLEAGHLDLSATQKVSVSAAHSVSNGQGASTSPVAVQKAVIPLQKQTISTSQKTNAPAGQKVNAPVGQKADAPVGQKVDSVGQKTSALAGKVNALAQQKTTSSIEQIANAPAAQKIKASNGKTQQKSASRSHVSTPNRMKSNNVSVSSSDYEYLTCRVLASEASLAVVTAAGKKILVARSDLYVNEVLLPRSANVAVLLKKFPNIGVLFAHSGQQHHILGHTVEYVALVAWAGKKPQTANTIANQRLSSMKVAAAPKAPPSLAAAVTRKKPKTANSIASQRLSSMKAVAATKAPASEPTTPLAAAVTVNTICYIKQALDRNVKLKVWSKLLPNGCGTTVIDPGAMYHNGTPMTLELAEKLRGQFFYCQLLIEDGGKQLRCLKAWYGKKPATDASSQSSVMQSRQALNTGDQNSALDLPLVSSTSKSVSQMGKLVTPSVLPSKVWMGEVTEVKQKGGCLRAEDGRYYDFPIEVCFLFDMCLHQVEEQVLVVGMKVEFEVVSCGNNETVQRVWVGGRDASLTFLSQELMVHSWCERNDIAPSTQRALMKEAELLSPSLIPTASRMEATKIIDITA